MNSPSSPIDPATDEQASLWAARLDGGILSSADRANLEAWLAEDPAHREHLSLYCQFSADLEQQLPLMEGIVDASAEMIVEATARPNPWLRLPALAGVALSVAAAVAFVFWVRGPAGQTGEFSSPAAHRQEITLVDGSHVELNARTAFSVELNRSERHVRLTSGEAFFEVTKDASRPFIVETPAGTVRVTGTHFDVRADGPSGLRVTVESGSVQVRPTATGSAQSVVSLTNRDQFWTDAHGFSTHSLSPSDLEDALAWRDGAVVFAGTPLREALACFAQYHGCVMSAGAGAGDLRVGGRFGLDDSEAFFAALVQVLPVKVERRTNGSIEVNLRSAP
ncbi:MAG TPA: FecR domain-containing protein [Candidatus Didemnitutus sp.]|jgi:transmembrane sensor